MRTRISTRLRGPRTSSRRARTSAAVAAVADAAVAAMKRKPPLTRPRRGKRPSKMQRRRKSRWLARLVERTATRMRVRRTPTLNGAAGVVDDAAADGAGDARAD